GRESQTGCGYRRKRVAFIGVSARLACVSSELPRPKSDYQRDECGNPGGGRGAIQRLVDYGPARAGSKPRGLRRTGEHHFENELGTKPVGEARREAGAGG